KIPCRIYAPVGGHRELLAYLVRRLLENGDNSSFVALVGDRTVPAKDLLRRPAELLDNGNRVRHPRIPLPSRLYEPTRRNSRGMEFGSRVDLEALVGGLGKTAGLKPEAGRGSGERQPVVSPVDGKTVVGEATSTPPSALDEIFRR